MSRFFKNLFAHRGLVTKDSPENTIASLEAAHAAGFRAIEFDLWFLDGKILIKHNKPEGEDLPSLAEYFRYGNEMIYWLDFKNLHEGNVRNAMECVALEIKKAQIDLSKILFVPCEWNYELAAKLHSQVRKVFGNEVRFGAFCRDREKIHDLKKFCATNGVKFLSIFHELIDADFVKKFSDQEIFAWTVNEAKRLEELSGLGVKNFATDKTLSVFH